MKTTALILLLAFGMRAQNWDFDMDKKDKQAHMWASGLGTIVLGNTYYHFTERPGLSSILGGVTMFGIGLTKEIVYDGIMKRGVKSKGDLFADGWGCVTGIIMCRVVIDIKEKKQSKNKVYEY